MRGFAQPLTKDDLSKLAAAKAELNGDALNASPSDADVDADADNDNDELEAA